jgi:hypothetical protein
MVGAQDGGVARQIVEAVHDDSHHDVEHNEAAEKNEGDKVEVGDVGAARFFWVVFETGGDVVIEGLLVTDPTANAGHHDVGPSLARRTTEEQHESLEDASKVVVALDGSVGVQVDAAEELHADDGVDEEEHHHEHHNVGQGLQAYNGLPSGWACC